MDRLHLSDLTSHSSIHPFAFGKGRLSPLTCLGFIALLALMTPLTAFARNHYSMDVTIIEYCGFQGNDTEGNSLFGVKVRHKGDFYYVELESAMPSLRERIRDTVRITMSARNNRWESVTFGEHFSRIHQIVKIAPPNPETPSQPTPRTPSSIFYYDD